MPRNAVIYARISLDQRDGAGVERQELECRALAQREGYEVIEVCVDNSVSAYSGVRRPAFERAVELLTSGKATVLLCWHLDRVTRSLDDLQRLLRINGLLVHPVTGTVVDTSDASAVMSGSILTVVSRFESQHKSERVIAAARAKAQKGLLTSGRIWGYRADGTATEEARLAIPTLFETFIRTHNLEAARDAFIQIAPNAPSSRTVTRSRLTQPAYAGISTFRGEVFDVEPQWEPLIPREVFRRAEVILNSPNRRYTGHERGVVQGLGTGLFICGKCGESMIAGGVMNTAGGKRQAYRCRTNAHLNRDREDIDRAVMALLLWRLEIASAKAALLPRNDAPDPAARLSERLTEAERKLAEVTEDYVADLLPRSTALPAIERLRNEIEAMGRELATMGWEGPKPRAYNVSQTIIALPLHALRQVLAATMVVTLPPLPPPTGLRKKGKRVGLREGSITVEWLDEPGFDGWHSSHHRPDWSGLTWPLPDAPDWLLDQLNGAPALSPSVRQAVWRAVAPYAVGVEPLPRTSDGDLDMAQVADIASDQA